MKIRILLFTLIFSLSLGIAVFANSVTQVSSNFVINISSTTENNITFNTTENNATQTAWNETFFGNENKTFYIRLPKNSVVLSGAKLNLTGIDGVRGYIGDDTEDEFDGGAFSDENNMVDENLGTSTACVVACTAYINYTIPSYAFNDSRWQYKTNSDGDEVKGYCYDGSWSEVWSGSGSLETVNVTIPSACLVEDKLLFKIYMLTGLNSPLFYEEMVYWNISNITTSPYLDVGGDGDTEWTHTEDDGTFNSTYSPNRTDDFSSELNDVLSICSADANGNCDINLTLHSDTAGIIQVDDINITFNYNMTELFTEGSIYWNETTDIDVNATYEKWKNVNHSSNKVPNVTISTVGYYLNNASAITYCKIDGVNKTSTGSPAYCPLVEVHNYTGRWTNHSLYFNDSAGVPAVHTETVPQESGFDYFKNATIKGYDVDDVECTSCLTNATFTVYLNTSIASDEYLKVYDQTNGIFVDITPATAETDCNSASPTFTKSTVDSKDYFICMQDLNADNVNDFVVKTPI